MFIDSVAIEILKYRQKKYWETAKSLTEKLLKKLKSTEKVENNET